MQSWRPWKPNSASVGGMVVAGVAMVAGVVGKEAEGAMAL